MYWSLRRSLFVYTFFYTTLINWFKNFALSVLYFRLKRGIFINNYISSCSYHQLVTFTRRENKKSVIYRRLGLYYKLDYTCSKHETGKNFQKVIRVWKWKILSLYSNWKIWKLAKKKRKKNHQVFDYQQPLKLLEKGINQMTRLRTSKSWSQDTSMLRESVVYSGSE